MTLQNPSRDASNPFSRGRRSVVRLLFGLTLAAPVLAACASMEGQPAVSPEYHGGRDHDGRGGGGGGGAGGGRG